MRGFGSALGMVALVLVGAGGVTAGAAHVGGHARCATARPTLPSAPSVHLALGTPVDADPSDDEVMVKPEYALSYNRARNATNWVSWELNASYLGSAHRHRGRFLPDETLPSSWYRVRHEDYSGSVYDRGHILPAEDRTRTPEANLATFRLTNVLPQRHELNVGPWLRLEEYCHALAAKEGRELYIVAGGIFGAHPETIGHGVSVPDAFFKNRGGAEPRRGSRRRARIDVRHCRHHGEHGRVASRLMGVLSHHGERSRAPHGLRLPDACTPAAPAGDRAARRPGTLAVIRTVRPRRSTRRQAWWGCEARAAATDACSGGFRQ